MLYNCATRQACAMLLCTLDTFVQSEVASPYSYTTFESTHVRASECRCTQRILDPPARP